MQKIKISATLGIISLACALLIALVNLVTSPIITKHDKETEVSACKEIFSEYDEDNFFEVENLDGKDSRILKIFLVKDNDNVEGSIYKVSGKNAYGTITLMVGITKENTVKQVVFIENGQSFASTVNNHVSSNYPSAESTDVHLGAAPKASSSSAGELSLSSVAGIDVKCGATYGATLVKELVTVALEDAIKEAE
jgi:hypothetical protein